MSSKYYKKRDAVYVEHTVLIDGDFWKFIKYCFELYMAHRGDSSAFSWDLKPAIGYVY